MTVFSNDTVVGNLVVQNVPERACFSTWQEFIQAIPTFIQVQVPSSVSGIISSSDAPDEDDRDKLWLRRDTSGGVLGLYAFQQGAWRKLYPYDYNTVIWQVGDSANIPDGFELIKAGVLDIPPTTVNAIMSQYAPNGIGGFSYFAMRFVGY